jgi:kinetochore protein Spc25, fungi type
LSVASFKRQLASLKERCSSIESEIEQYRAITANLRRGQLCFIWLSVLMSNRTEKNKERSTLATQLSCASPELSACEQRLSCVVEGIEKDQLLVRFCRVDRSDSKREFSFVIDVTDRIYKGRNVRKVNDSSNSYIRTSVNIIATFALPADID